MGAFIGIFLAIILIAVAAILVVIGIRQQNSYDPLEERLAEYASSGEVTSLGDIELSQPFMERVVLPMAIKLGGIALRFTPENALNDINKKLNMAGSETDPTVFLAIKLVASFAIGGGLFAFQNFGPNAATNSFLMKFIVPFAVFFLGYQLPDFMLSTKITKRQEDVVKSLPDALDLLTICVEAGLGFDAAMKKVAEKWDNELARAFQRALREMQLGKIRRVALRDMSDRLQVSDLDSFVGTVIQSEQLGVSMAKVLRIQSDDMRVKRRQRAQEQAQKAPVKMLLPLVFLIFPTILVILLAPAILMIMASGAMSALGQ